MALVRPVAAHAKCVAGRQAGSEHFDHCLQIELGALLDRAHGARQLHIHTTLQRRVVLRAEHLLETQLHGLYTASVDPCGNGLSVVTVLPILGALSAIGSMQCPRQEAPLQRHFLG